jgi:hypothetical protein
MDSPVPQRADDDKVQRQGLFTTYQAALYERQLANSRDFDSAILTYSAAGLGLSIAFLKDFVDIASAHAPALLSWSWWLFAAAIVVTVCSFPVAASANSKAHDIAQRYYIDKQDKAFDELASLIRIVTRLAYLAGALFVAAVLCTIMFASLNLERASQMAIQRRVLQQPAPSTPARRPIFDAAPPPQLQRMPDDERVERGAPPPPMQKVPSTPQPQQQPAPAGTPAGDDQSTVGGS